jgi:2',3'-cyclic-nucleotide 2'-phosphodiesterase (5'-nucleotidase family)
MQHLVRMAKSAGAAGLLALIGFAPALAATQTLTILHDNDIHGRLRPFCYIEVAKGPAEHCNLGGAARRMTLIRALKAKARAPVLLIDSGDTATRGPLATEYEGVDEIETMNAMGYDMATVGNNEFKLKDSADQMDAAGAQASLAKLVRFSSFPWLCANCTDAATGAILTGVQPFVVRRVGKLKIAFLGLTTLKSVNYSQTKGLKFVDPVESAKLWVPLARAEADVVIAVTHLGDDGDQKLVHATRGIDAVIGGDSHTFLYEPLAEKNLDGVVVPVLQDGEFGVRLGRFDLTFTGDAATGWRLAHYTDVLIPVGAAIRPDPKIAALVGRYADPLDKIVGSVAAVGATPAERTRLTAQAIAAALKASAGTEIGLHRAADLYDVFRTRRVTRFQVRAALPFHDTVWRGQIAGAKLKELLSPSDPAKAVWATLPPAEIDPGKTYTAAAIGFIGKTLFTGGVDTGRDDREATEAWLGDSTRR